MPCCHTSLLVPTRFKRRWPKCAPMKIWMWCQGAARGQSLSSFRSCWVKCGEQIYVEMDIAQGVPCELSFIQKWSSVCFGLNYEDVFCFVTRMDSLGALVTLLWQMPAGNPQWKPFFSSFVMHILLNALRCQDLRRCCFRHPALAHN